MTIDCNPTVTAEDLRDALPKAKSLVSSEWLTKQKRYRSNDPTLLNPKLSLGTANQINQAIKQGGFSKQAMHPIAECILSAEKSLRDFEEGRRTLPSIISSCRLLSLKDIANFRHAISGSEERIARLTTKEGWESSLQELVIAASYPQEMEAQFVPEAKVSTPDIQLKGGIDVECKLRKFFEQKVIAFIKCWQNTQLLEVMQFALGTNLSVIIRIEVESVDDFQCLHKGSVAKTVIEMFVKEQISKSNYSYNVDLETFNLSERYFSEPIASQSKEFWFDGWGFDEWNEWHHISPYSEQALWDSNPAFVTKYRQRILVCIRAKELVDSAPSIANSIKYACKNQLTNTKSGIIHMRLNSALFGLDKVRSPLKVAKKIEPEINKLFSDYSRLWKVYLDILEYNSMLPLENPRCSRVVATNLKGNAPESFVSPSPVLLV